MKMIWILSTQLKLDLLYDQNPTWYVYHFSKNTLQKQKKPHIQRNAELHTIPVKAALMSDTAVLRLLGQLRL